VSSWREKVRPDDLPGDLALVAQELGTETAIRLAERFGGVHLYIVQAGSVLYAAKARWVLDHPEIPPRDAALATGLSERQVYRLRAGAGVEDKGPSLPFSG
jgi:hypothetical protein